MKKHKTKIMQLNTYLIKNKYKIISAEISQPEHTEWLQDAKGRIIKKVITDEILTIKFYPKIRFINCENKTI